MKKHIYIIATALLTLSLVSCEKDFLEEKPTEQLSTEQINDAVAKDPSLLNGSIAGLYSAMYNTGTGGTDGHDDFGQKGYDIFSDMLSSDMVLAGVNYGWYTQVVRYQGTTNNTLNPAYIPWRYYYRIILAANTVIDALGGTDTVPETTELKFIMGQAKAMRGYAYFYLSQFYSAKYGDGTEKILPIYTSATQPNQPKSTAEDVYNLMIDDLSDAVEYLDGFSRTSKDQINQDVAKGLLAYVLAARGTTADLDRVITLTDEIISNGTYPLTTRDETVGRLDETGALLNPEAGFNNIATPSWMWGVDLTLASNLDLISWWGQVDLFTYSYAWAGDPKTIDKGLYDAIKADDIRKGQFDPVDGGIETLPRYADDGYEEGDLDYVPVNKFFDPARVIGGQRNVITDYVYMRIDEMYLLNAEAKAKRGLDGPARDRLKELLTERMDDINYVNLLSGQALQDEIYLQTRIELWGEGKSYLALKRNKATVTRGSNHIYNAGESFAYDSDELTFPIPQAEVINNPVLNN